MRIDKFLKVSRLIKRRTVAKELASRDIFYVNDRIAKPSTDIKENDIVFLPLGRHHLTIKILNCLEHASKEQASKMYEIIKDKIVDED